jgi:hypothetical protein
MDLARTYLHDEQSEHQSYQRKFSYRRSGSGYDVDILKNSGFQLHSFYKD